jgi:nicotinamidase-related amidase
MKALLVIDIQKRLTGKPGFYRPEKFLETVNAAIFRFRELDLPVIFIQHNDKFLVYGSETWEIDDRIDQSMLDLNIQKIHADAFRQTDLSSLLDGMNVNQVYICGVASHACVKYTCFGALARNLECFLLKDGHSGWNRNQAELAAQTESELIALGVNVIDVNSL